ncbi:MAG: hypothetical protein LDL19_09085 [Thiobacillus sp.]|nr:hypothetical protein [Thiobacillus sp.]
MFSSLEKILQGKRHASPEDFDRTIIDLPAPSQLKDLCLNSADAAMQENLGEQRFKFRFATSLEALHGASLLVQKRYAWRGYPAQPLKKYPNRVTLLTSINERIVGTVTIGYDSGEGLFADELYKVEVDALRARGRKVGELNKLAIDKTLGSKHVLGGIIHIAYIYGLIYGCTDAVIEVVPRHREFYERMLGFKQLGPERPNPKADNAPALLMHLPLEYMSEKIAQVGGKGPDGDDHSLYPYFFSLYEQEGIMKRLLGGN